MTGLSLASLVRGALIAAVPLTVASAPLGAATVDPDGSVWTGLGRPAALVKNPFVRPTWIGNSDRFWYRRDTATGHDYRIVDAATGQSHAAFDHSALSAALGRLGVKQSADQLGLEKLRFANDEKSLWFEIEGRPFVCQLADMQCREQDRLPAGLLVSPDGKQAAFVRDANVWVRDLSTGRERQLTNDGQADNGYGIYPDGWKAGFVSRAKEPAPLAPWQVSWSPDSSKLLVPHLDQRHVATYPFIEYVPEDSFRPKVYNAHLPLVGERPADLTWFVVNTETGTKTKLQLPYDKLLPLQQDLVALQRIVWSADGSRLDLAAFSNELKTSYLFDASTRTGAVRTIIQETGEHHANLNSTSYNPPNVQVVNDGADIIWYSERDGWGHLYRYDGRTGALKNRLTSGKWLVRDIIAVDGARRLVYFTGSAREHGDPYYRYLYKVKFDGSGLTLLTPETLDHLLSGDDNNDVLFDGAEGYKVVSPSGRYLVYNASALDRPPEASIRRTDGSLISTFQKADASKLFDAGYQPPVAMMLKAAAGADPVYGVLYKPAELDPQKHYPIVDTEYDSPLTAVAPHNFMSALDIPVRLQPSALVHHGFAAVVIDARGTTYRSRAFSDGMIGKLDTMNIDDHVVAIKAIAKNYTWLDTSRVGISGSSYGGWTALRAMLTEPDFFKVGIAIVPPGTFHSLYVDYHWSAFQGTPTYSGGSLLRPTPLDVPENWRALDSDAQVDRLKGKLLMIVGGLDENVPAGSAMRFFEKAANAGKDVSLIYMPSADHHNAIDEYSWRKAVEFLQAGLGGPR